MTSEAAFETKRFRMDPLGYGPAEKAYIMEAFNDYDVVKQLANPPYPYTDQHHELWVERRKANPDMGQIWNIRRTLDPDKVIGHIGARQFQDDQWVLYYHCLQSVWGQGYMTEALGGLVAHLFGDHQAETLVTMVLDDNPASMRILEKCGFKISGHGTAKSRARGGDVDYPQTQFGLTRQQYLEALS